MVMIIRNVLNIWYSMLQFQFTLTIPYMSCKVNNKHRLMRFTVFGLMICNYLCIKTHRLQCTLDYSSNKTGIVYVSPTFAVNVIRRRVDKAKHERVTVKDEEAIWVTLTLKIAGSFAKPLRSQLSLKQLQGSVNGQRSLTHLCLIT